MVCSSLVPHPSAVFTYRSSSPHVIKLRSTIQVRVASDRRPCYSLQHIVRPCCNLATITSDFLSASSTPTSRCCLAHPFHASFRTSDRSTSHPVTCHFQAHLRQILYPQLIPRIYFRLYHHRFVPGSAKRLNSEFALILVDENERMWHGKMFTRGDSLQSLASTWARILTELWAWFTRILSECGGGRVRKSPARLRQHREVSYSPIRVGNKGKLQVANLKVCVQWAFIMREIDERMSTSALTVGRLAHPFLVTRPSDRREVIKIGSRGRCHCLHSLQHSRVTEVWACVRRVISLLCTEVCLPLLPIPPLLPTLSSQLYPLLLLFTTLPR